MKKLIISSALLCALLSVFASCVTQSGCPGRITGKPTPNATQVKPA